MSIKKIYKSLVYNLTVKIIENRTIQITFNVNSTKYIKHIIPIIKYTIYDHVYYTQCRI